MYQTIVTDDEIIAEIKRYINKHSYPPSSKELGDIVGYGYSQMSNRLNQMIRKGKLESDHGERNSRAFRIPGMKIAFKEAEHEKRI